MALLIDIKHPDWLSDDVLRDALFGTEPRADIRIGAAPGNLGEIEMLVVSTYLPGEALRYPNLKLIQKTGAGVNNILADEQLPAELQVARLQSSTSGNQMAEYALAYVLQEQRHIRQYRQQQSRAEWLSYPPRQAAQTNVAVLGLGLIGKIIAQRFVDNGFVVLGWSRSTREMAGVTCYAGIDELPRVLEPAHYVISVLPSTPETRYLFNQELFAKFNPQAVFINVGRGDLVDEPGLLAALEHEQLAGAVLDVMSVEPLPATSELWSHSKLQLTPHISGYDLGDAISDIAENYRRLQSGEPLLHIIDRQLGY